MPQIDSTYLYAIASSFCFATGSVFLGVYSRKVSSRWMACFKVCVAWIGYLLILLILGHTFFANNTAVNFALLLSGFVGLAFGDICLLSAFARIGAGRGLMLFAFTPLFMAVGGYFLFGQSMTLNQLGAIFFLIFCLITLSYERFKSDGHWEIKGLIFALLGVVLDAAGIFLTRFAIDNSENLLMTQVNFVRCTGALIGFFVLSRFISIDILSRFKQLDLTNKLGTIITSLLTTLLALLLLVHAIGKGHLASVTALAGAHPIFATVFESVLSRRFPSRYFWIAFFSFLMGFSLLVQH